MKLPRNIDGADLAQHLIRHWQFRKLHQSGSHILLVTDTPSPYTATIPAHRPLKTGTLAGILKQVATHKQVTRDELLEHL